MNLIFCFSKQKMVPQHTQDTNIIMSRHVDQEIILDESMTAHLLDLSNDVIFGSMLVDKNSSTPYTDATQVSF